MERGEEDYIPLSALQHYAYCPRRCALIHTERLWRENSLTTLGKIEHENVDSGQSNQRKYIRNERSVQLINHRLGIRGIADLIEYHLDAKDGHIISAEIVEYKHGRPEKHQADEMQLCAQALCIEEMQGLSITESSLYYGAIRRRTTIKLDAELRQRCEETIRATRALLQSQQLPPAYKKAGCRSCSLYEDCLPVKREQSVKAYNQRMLSSESLGAEANPPEIDA